jgi:hypothetical protein
MTSSNVKCRAQPARRGGRRLSQFGVRRDPIFLHSARAVPQNLRREDGQRANRGRVVTLCSKQSPWKLLAQFSLSRERDVANIIA